MSIDRKSVHYHVPVDPELALENVEPSNSREQRLLIQHDDELNQLLARLKSKFAPQPAFLQVKREPGAVTPATIIDDHYLAATETSGTREADGHELLDNDAESVAAIVEIEASTSLPSLNSTISRLANYLSDKHGKNFDNQSSEPVKRGPVDKRTLFSQQLTRQFADERKQQQQQPPQQPAYLLHPQQVSVAAVKARLISIDREKQFSCYICQRRFHLFAHLRNHLETHTGEKPHECNQCGKCFATSTSLKRHVPIHHLNKKHRCSICDKAYANQGYLKVHMRIHRDEKPFDCELCGRAFRQLAHLNHHLLTHTGDKPHKCDLCGQRFRQANTLEDHMRLHTGERPHCCTICGKSFTHRLSLKLHMRYHTEAGQLNPQEGARQLSSKHLIGRDDSSVDDVEVIA